MQHDQIRCIPYSGASNDTDVNLSIRCQFAAIRKDWQPADAPLGHQLSSDKSDDQTLRTVLDDLIFILIRVMLRICKRKYFRTPHRAFG